MRLKSNIVYDAVKVCTLLTMASSEISRKHVALQTSSMQQVCDAFVAENAIAVVVTLLADPLSRHPSMKDKDYALVELVVTFLRNLLAATAPPPGASFQQKEACKRSHANLVNRFFEDNVMDLLMIMAQHSREVGVTNLFHRTRDVWSCPA